MEEIRPLPHEQYLERVRAYQRVYGQDAPPPTPSGSYACAWNGHHYVLVGDERKILATYRLFRGSLRLMGATPRGLRQRHRERVGRDGHAAA